MEIIPKWQVLVVQGLGFLLLLAVFRAFLFKPIGAILEARRREVDERYDDAETQRAVAAQLKDEYEQHLTAIDEEMRAKITAAVKEGQAMREEILADSRARAETILAKAHDEISRQEESAMAELRSTIAGLALEAAGKIVDEQLDEQKHRQLIGRVIDTLDGESK